jgi:predicted nucleic acid-binding protein
VSAIVDTGPLVALIDRRERHHAWARETLGGLEPPLLTCEAVISEACFVLGHLKGGRNAVLSLVSRGIVVPTFRLESESEAVRKLVMKYANVPMSLADACLLRMSELAPRMAVITLDSDFRTYRRNGRQVVPVVMPD